jgi:hypothetical protein
MHEIARHIIHSSETITVAVEILNSMLKCYSNILHSSSAVEIDTQAELQQQASLLKCLQLRSQAVEARLRNEINLVSTGHRLIICIHYCVGLCQKKLIGI